jgi:phosphate butyryltransferase
VKVLSRDGDLYGIEDVLDRCRELVSATLVVSRPYDDATLLSLSEACSMGIIHPLLVGNAGLMGERSRRLGIDTGSFELVDAPEDGILERTAALYHDGEADLIMKGLVGTGDFLHVLLDPRWKIRTEGILSHVGMFEIPDTGRVYLMSDAAINILPNFNRKMEIVRNAVDAARRLGITRVRVAMLAAVEKVRLPAMPATMDAFLMKRYARSGYFGRCAVDGPLAFDNAIDPERADTKSIGGSVAGRANVLIVPNIETGNAIWKAITVLHHHDAAGVVTGGSCPIVVPSRSDNARTKLLSIQFARLSLANGGDTKSKSRHGDGGRS